jgi:hypothetical protein
LAKPSNIPKELVLTVNYQPENPISGFEGGTEYTIQVLLNGELYALPHETKKRVEQRDTEIIINVGLGKKRKSIEIDKVLLKEAIQAP